jgi:beta-galactosidase
MSVANYGNGDLVEKANYTPIKPASPVLGYELIDARSKVLASASATVSVKGRGENDYKFPEINIREFQHGLQNLPTCISW